MGVWTGYGLQYLPKRYECAIVAGFVFKYSLTYFGCFILTMHCAFDNTLLRRKSLEGESSR